MNDLELHPLPVVAGFMFAAMHLEDPFVYRFHVDRWHLSANGQEWMLVELPDGSLHLVDNPF